MQIPTPISEHDYGVPIIKGSSQIHRGQVVPHYDGELAPLPTPEEIAPPTARFHPVPTGDVFRPDPREPSPQKSDQPIYFSPPVNTPIVPLDPTR